MVPLLVRLPLPRLAALLDRAGRRAPRSPSRYCQPAQVNRYLQIAQQAGRPLIRRGCLTRGLTLYWFLVRAGRPVQLCFGMGQVEEELAGHCWVTMAGEPILEPAPPEDTFSTLYTIPAS